VFIEEFPDCLHALYRSGLIERDILGVELGLELKLNLQAVSLASKNDFSDRLFLGEKIVGDELKALDE
jgi:hypothetical protein